MSKPETYRQPWLFSPKLDLPFILFPAFGTALLVILFPEWFQETTVSPFFWLLLVVGVDVSHVYSTLYRTYFDKEEFQRYRKPLILIPLLGLIGGILVYLSDPLWFWRLLAYLAVYHFVRQQYGFFALYRRKEAPQKGGGRALDAMAIYGATLFPMIWWHTHLPRKFNWFIDGDFWGYDLPWLAWTAAAAYALVLILYTIKEFRKVRAAGKFNWPKNLLLLGTALSWTVGIVIFNSDLAFTFTNVVSHGIPYMALIWVYGHKKKGEEATASSPSRISRIFRLSSIPIFIGLLFLFGYIEEGLWDGMVWFEHPGLFPWAHSFEFSAASIPLWFVVPLLTLPQLTHYLIDGFIWRIRKPDSELSNLDR